MEIGDGPYPDARHDVGGRPGHAHDPKIDRPAGDAQLGSPSLHMQAVRCERVDDVPDEPLVLQRQQTPAVEQSKSVRRPLHVEVGEGAKPAPGRHRECDHSRSRGPAPRFEDPVPAGVSHGGQQLVPVHHWRKGGNDGQAGMEEPPMARRLVHEVGDIAGMRCAGCGPTGQPREGEINPVRPRRAPQRFAAVPSPAAQHGVHIVLLGGRIDANQVERRQPGVDGAGAQHRRPRDTDGLEPGASRRHREPGPAPPVGIGDYPDRPAHSPTAT